MFAAFVGNNENKGLCVVACRGFRETIAAGQMRNKGAPRLILKLWSGVK